MSHDLATRAELAKLARVLDTSPEEVAFLSSLDATDIHELREAISASLHDRYREVYRRVASASRLLPSGLCVQIAERAFPPAITSKVAAEIDTDRIGDFASKLSVSYMADVCVDIDPRKVRELIRRVPVDRAVAVALELIERQEYVTLGRMIDAATPELVRAAVEAVDSDDALLWIAFYAESVPHLTSAVRALPDERLRGVVHTALGGPEERHAAGLALMARVDDADLRRTLGDHAADAPDSALSYLVRTAVREGFEPELLTVVAGMDEAAARRMASLEVLAEEEVLLALARAADDGGHREQLLPLVEHATTEVRSALERAGFVTD
ncbi:hypothetical protein [Haloechinothrix sp. LS1_15]|uniref:hypothetical protein n=1 Tax=Haloechinothrix sp. LS1_15 TaxID=2652248 RepID=UPI002944AE60|nr:hypothetical protein [Haloechinothrix sp. LS1_15]MDV6014745.1 hypothetical protein [Haloechinothrix sp. LS1_15]